MSKNYTNKNNIKMRDEDCEDCSNEKSDLLGFTVKQKSFYNFNVHINTDIKAPDHYSKVFEMLLDISEDDVVDFYIVSPGGRLDGLNVLLEGIRLTDAHTRAILIGEASSAASILALNCSEVIVTNSAEMLCHHCLYSVGGKAADISAHVDHTTKITEKLLQSTYEGFMNTHELDLMLQGKQWYFDADEIRERLLQRDEALEAKFLAEQEEAKALQEQDEPKPKRKKKN